jgi:hypothetical protein
MPIWSEHIRFLCFEVWDGAFPVSLSWYCANRLIQDNTSRWYGSASLPISVRHTLHFSAPVFYFPTIIDRTMRHSIYTEWDPIQMLNSSSHCCLLDWDTVSHTYVSEEHAASIFKAKMLFSALLLTRTVFCFPWKWKIALLARKSKHDQTLSSSHSYIHFDHEERGSKVIRNFGTSLQDCRN